MTSKVKANPNAVLSVSLPRIAATARMMSGRMRTAAEIVAKVRPHTGDVGLRTCGGIGSCLPRRSLRSPPVPSALTSPAESSPVSEGKGRGKKAEGKEVGGAPARDNDDGAYRVSAGQAGGACSAESQSPLRIG
jgi:hypothetical protein